MLPDRKFDRGSGQRYGQNVDFFSDTLANSYRFDHPYKAYVCRTSPDDFRSELLTVASFQGQAIGCTSNLKRSSSSATTSGGVKPATQRNTIPLNKSKRKTIAFTRNYSICMVCGLLEYIPVMRLKRTDTSFDPSQIGKRSWREKRKGFRGWGRA